MECFVTVLMPHDRNVAPGSLAPRVRIEPTSAPYRSVAVRIDDGDRTSLILVKTDLDMEIARENIRPRYLYDLGKVSVGDFETDAHFLYAVEDSSGMSYSALTFLKVLYRGKTLVGALPNTHALQLDGTDTRIGYSKWRRWEDTVSRSGSEKR
jgi:hypothetical protein